MHKDSQFDVIISLHAVLTLKWISSTQWKAFQHSNIHVAYDLGKKEQNNKIQFTSNMKWGAYCSKWT
jgi:hypothetical protein